MQKRFWGGGLVVVVILALLGSRGIINFLSRHEPNALWYVVDQHCARSKNHRPCAVYDPEQGFAMLKDLFGKGQYLLIPTKKITGLESPLLLDPATPNYLALAWEQRDLVRKAYKKAGFSEEKLPDGIFSLTVNSVPGRSQNQLHIHIDCLRKDVLATLQDMALHAPQKLQTGKEIILRGHRFRVWRLADLSPSPFLLFTDEGEDVRNNHGIAVIALKNPLGNGEEKERENERNEFLFLEDRAKNNIVNDMTKLLEGEKPDFGNAEWIQDHHCAVARD